MLEFQGSIDTAMAVTGYRGECQFVFTCKRAGEQVSTANTDCGTGGYIYPVMFFPYTRLQPTYVDTMYAGIPHFHP